MARIDDYIAAKKLAIEQLRSHSIDNLAARSGFGKIAENRLQVRFLDRTYRIEIPEYRFEDIDNADREVPIQEQVLLLHYLTAGADAPLPSNQWVSYREIPGASFYYSAFVKRAIDPLKKVFGSQGEALTKAANRLGAAAIDAGDTGFEFQVLPHVPVQLVVYHADEEFPAEANILFDRSVAERLSPEDVAWLAGMLVYRLMALAR